MNKTRLVSKTFFLLLIMITRDKLLLINEFMTTRDGMILFASPDTFNYVEKINNPNGT